MRPATRNARAERRLTARNPVNSPALVGSRHQPRGKFENGIVEDEGGGGIRLKCGRPLAVDESAMVFVGDEPHPMRVKVMWSRAEGFIEKRASGRVGNAYAAGCRVLPAEPAKKARPMNKALASTAGTLTAGAVTILVKLFFWGSIVAGVGGLIYFGSALLSLMK